MNLSAEPYPQAVSAIEAPTFVPAMIGGGEMGEHVRSMDWSGTPLGAYATWPQSLRSALSLVLNTKGIAALYWGPEQWLLYNDAYGQALGDRHPWAFGRPMPEALSDIAPVLGPQVADVLRTGVGFSIENLPMVMRRHGRDEDTVWTYSFSPVQGETGAFAGVLLLATEMTRQKEAERSEKQSKARLEAALKVAGLGTYDWHPSIGVIDIDATGRAMFDLPAEGTLRQEDTFACLAPEDMERVQIEAAKVMGIDHPFDTGNLGRTIDFYYDLLRTDGSRRSILSSGVIIENGDGTRRMVGTFNDITDAKRARESLRALNATLEARVAALAAERDQLWRLSRSPFLICDTQGVWLNASPVWTEILGWTQAELIGRTSAWMEHPDDSAKTRHKVAEVAGGEIVRSFVNRFQARDGSYHWFSWTAVAEGERLFCVATDVTEARFQAEALRQSQMRADTYFEFSTDYLFLIRIGADGVVRFEDMNPACRNAMDLVHADLASRPVVDCVPSDSAQDISKYARLCLATRQPQTYLAVREYQDGHSLIIEGHVTFVEHTSPDEGLVLFSGRDVTEQRHTEDALRQSQKMEAVGQLTGGLAHDFNNLLTGVTGSLELLQTRIAQGRIKDVDRYVNAAQGAAKRAAALTHRLLAFSRRQTLDPKPTDVNRLILGMEDLIRRTVGPEITVEPAVSAVALWPTLVDPSQLENALLNLCINARDAMPDGGKITIETGNRWLDERTAKERDLVPGQYVSLCVSDTGTGMPPEVIAKAFDPFFTTKPIGQGTGLGLSMIYGFAKQSGGQVRIYSEIGQGTNVCIYLPRHLGAAEVAEMTPEPTDAPRAEQGQTVLVVDDEPTVRMLVTEVLEDLGYRAIEAGDGAAGLKVLQSEVRVDLLVTDVGLPGGMNGRQVADAARVARPGLKVLFITGYAENAVLSHGHLDPGMHVLTKPFAMEGLARRIKSLISD